MYFVSIKSVCVAETLSEDSDMLFRQKQLPGETFFIYMF